MKLFVGVTNNDWFRFLSERKPDEVNFWRPRSQTDFTAMQPRDLFVFIQEWGGTGQPFVSPNHTSSHRRGAQRG